MISSAHAGDADPESPVFGATEFTGRTRFAQNLFRRCLRHQSILLYGGPRLGKTSMLLQLKWLVDKERKDSSSPPSAANLDLSEQGARDKLLLGRWSSPAPILLLDNCDHLLEQNCIDKVRDFMNRNAPGHGVIWAGARSWHDFVMEQRSTVDLRPAPLAVLLEGEARDVVKSQLTPDQITDALAAGGTHPYVLKVLAHLMVSFPGDPPRALAAAAGQLLPFFQACREALREGPEQALFEYLVQEARPITPGKAAGALGLGAIKSAGDTLCWLGLISRWNLNEGAMLQANCPIFNDWYVSTEGKTPLLDLRQ
jgi:hypothetical protein